MKKIINILIIIFLCISILFICDYFQYRIAIEDLPNKKPQKNYLFQMFHPNYYTLQSSKLHNKPFADKLRYYRKNMYNNINNRKKQSIIIFGCSFAEGALLKDEDRFSNKLSKYINRNVYNMSLSACGIQHMYHLLKDDCFHKYIYKKEINAPQYAIYVYIPNHLQRISSKTFSSMATCNGDNLIYELKKNKLVEKKYFPFIHKLYLLKKINLLIENKNPPNTLEMKYKNFAIAHELFIESKKILEKHYPNIKFVILKYNYDTTDWNYELPFMWDVLENEGFIIIDSKDLIGRIYTQKDTTEDNFHPNAQAWEELIPPLIEKLKL